MNTRFEPISEHHGYLNITLDQADYMPQFDEELKKIKKNASIKGFRQGAAPDSMLRKLYGDGIKGDLLQKKLNAIIENYQKDQQLRFLGDLIPVPAEAENLQNESIEFKFEFGIAPKPLLEQMLDGFSIQKFKVEIPEERITEEVDHMRNRFGESTETEEPIIKEDFVEIEAYEMENGSLKEAGWKTEFPVSLGEHMHESFFEKVAGLKKSDSFVFNMDEVEKNLTQDDIKKYLLKINPDAAETPGNTFEGKILKVMRKQAATLSEEFYKKAFGPQSEVNSEEELRANIRTNLQSYFDVECIKLLDIELVKHMVKRAALNLPEAFLIKWLQQSYEEWRSKEGHELEHSMLHFKEGMAWNLIRDQIIVDHQIEVQVNDIIDLVISEMKNQYPGVQLPDESWQELAKRTLGNKEKATQYYVEEQNRKALEWIKQQIQIQEESISLDQFRDKVKALNEHHH